MSNAIDASVAARGIRRMHGHKQGLCRAALLGSISIAACAAANGAWAGEAAPDGTSADRRGAQIEELVVTAQKRNQLETEVPISMTVLDANELESQRVQNVEDFVLKVPNVSYFKQSFFNIGVNIRGISGKTGGKFSPVGVTVDDVSFGTTNVASILSSNFLDIDRVEVLRGPQGTLTGNNSEGGVINIVTAKPDTKAMSYSAFMDVSRFNTVLGKGVVNLPLSGDLAVRLVAYGESSDGAVKNIGPSGGDSGGHDWGGRAAVLWTPTDHFTLDASFNYDKQHSGVDTAIPIDAYLTAATRTTAINTLKGFGGDYFASDFIQGSGNNGGHVNIDFPEYVDYTNWFGTLHATEDFGKHKIDLIYSHYYFRLFNPEDGDQSPYANRAFTRTSKSNTDGAELRVTSEYSGNFNWVAGLSYNDERNPFFNFGEFGDNKLGGAYTTLWFKTLQQQNLRSEGVFANVFWDPAERIHVSAGLRYSDVRSEFGSVAVTTGGLGAVVPAVPLTATTLNPLSERIAVNYDLAKDLSAYVTYSTGFRAGYGNISTTVGHHATTIGTIDVPGQVRDERVANYEVGLKGLFFDRRASLSAAAFYMDYRDLQVQAGTVTDNGLLGQVFNLNAGKAFARGVEVEAEARPTRGLELRANVGYLDTRIDNLNNLPLASKDIPAVRPWTASATALYEFPLTGTWDANVRADYTFQARMFDTMTKVLATEYPEFNTVDLSAGVSNGRWGVTAYATNIFARTYWLGEVGATSGYLTGGLASFVPRTFGLRLTIKSP